MPRAMSARDKRALEEAILPAREVGEFEWPHEVEAMGERATLRLTRGKKRIMWDWYVPDRYRSVVGQPRVTGQIPEPHGRSTLPAQQWVREELRRRVLQAEKAIENGGVSREPGVLNDIPLSRLLSRFAGSQTYRDMRQRNPQGADQWDLWMAFFRATLGDEWRLYQTSPDVLRQLLAAYQRPWTRTMPDGSTVLQDTEAGHNTAAKVVRFFKRVCNWGIAEPDGPGQYLLDVDPFQRIRQKQMPRERDSEARTVGVAPDPYARAMYTRARERGEHGQFGVLFAGEAVTGRRVSEWRTLNRTDVLTDFEAVRSAVEAQLCRRVLPDDHIPDSELDAAARAYLDLSGVVVCFHEGKQAAADPENAAQYDRVIPLGPWLGAIVLDYLKHHWDPRGLPADAPLFPAAQDPSAPTAKDLVMKWWLRTERRVAELDEVRIPRGRTHTLRRRHRSAMRAADSKSVAFVAGWTLRRPGAMDRSYLPVHWPDVVDMVLESERRLAL